MQVHERPQAAPALVLRGIKNTGICMQNHALYGCMAFFRKNSGIFGGFFRVLPCGQFCTSAGVNQVLCRSEFLAIIIPRSRIRPESDGR